ncbi:MAG: hypothetical protein EBU83_02115 [bacterium]|jgi:hypothetical protein|nr:hypothetical protein [Candidatus Aquidulcis sp.]
MSEPKNEIIDISESNAIAGSNAIYNKITDPIQAIQVMGEMIWGSGMFGCVKPEQGMVLAMTCLAEGKAPLELAKTYHIIEGKLSMRADAMLGRFLTTGGKVKWLVRNDKEVKAVFIHSDSEVEIGCTVDEMKANGVAMGKSGLKDNWRKFPRQMLTARCISEGVRLLAPQIVSGIYTPEEVSDFSSQDKPLPVAKQLPSSPVEQVVSVADPAGAVASRLDDLLAKYEPTASEYLVSKSFLRAGQTYRDLDAMTAQRILANPSKIVTILEGIRKESL